jgi:glutathione synthase/RimK-type ligase-like ATP-grasp enzyme
MDINILLKQGEPAAANAAYRAYMKDNPVLNAKYPTKNDAISVLRLISGEGATVHTPHDNGSFVVTVQGHWEADHILFCDEFRTTTFSVLNDTDPEALIEQARHAQIVVNAIADPDLHNATLQIVEQARSSIRAPMINPSDRILRHTRDQVSKALGGVNNLVIPKTVRLSSSLGIDINAHGMRYPVIVRKCGTQTGKTMELVRTSVQLNNYCTILGSTPDIYLSEFIDFCSSDGLYRKYRVRIAGNKLCHNHMFFGNSWKVHGHAARELMLRNQWMINEENAFLNDNSSVISKSVHNALIDINSRVGVDFYGIDFAILPNGDVLLFEANASMRSVYPEWKESWPRTWLVTSKLVQHMRAHIRTIAFRAPDTVT